MRVARVCVFLRLFSLFQLPSVFTSSNGSFGRYFEIGATVLHVLVVFFTKISQEYILSSDVLDPFLSAARKFDCLFDDTMSELGSGFVEKACSVFCQCHSPPCFVFFFISYVCFSQRTGVFAVVQN